MKYLRLFLIPWVLDIINYNSIQTRISTIAIRTCQKIITQILEYACLICFFIYVIFSHKKVTIDHTGKCTNIWHHREQLCLPVFLFSIELNERPFDWLMTSLWLQIDIRMLIAANLVRYSFFISYSSCIYAVSHHQQVFVPKCRTTL